MTLLLLASLGGAASFFAAGYFTARRGPSWQDAADPGVSAAPMAPVTSLQAWVEEVARRSASRSVALFDDEGLALARTGAALELRLGALAGQLARLSREQGALPAVGARTVWSIEDDLGEAARLRCFRHGKHRLFLMTRGAGPDVARVEDDAIGHVQRLLRVA